MYFNKETLEQKIDTTERKICGLEDLVNTLDQEAAELFGELGVSGEQVCQYLDDSENFSLSSWDKIQEQRRLRDERLACELENIPDPRKAAEARRALEQPIGQHYLFVK